MSPERPVSLHRPPRVAGLFARAAALAAAASLALVAGCDRTPDVVKIGVAQPLTKGLAALGQDLVYGAQMAIDEINTTGGVNIQGKRVRLALVTADDQGDNAAGEAAAHKLVAQDVEVAIADLNSGVSIHTAPIYAAARVPQLAISTKPEYTQLGLPTTLRLVANDDLQSRALGSYAAQLPDARHFAVVDDNTPYGKGLADSAARVMSAQGKPIDVRRSLDDKTTEFSLLIADLVTSKVDVVVTTLSDFQVEALIQQLGKIGLTDITIVGGDTIKTGRLPRAAIPIHAVYATSSIVEPREFPGGKVFLEKFRALHHSDPVYGAHYAYDAVYLVADAIQRDGSVDKDALLKTLKEFDGNCPMTSSMRFGPDGEQRYAAVSVYQLKPGVWEPLMRSDRW
jgi:branched-chain amino acid transport system substrate-binding protein